MGSEVISMRHLESLYCVLACLCILRRDVSIIGPNGNRCYVPWDMASQAQHAGCWASGSREVSCCFSSPRSLHIRNNLPGTMLAITSTHSVLRQSTEQKRIFKYIPRLFFCICKSTQKQGQIVFIKSSDIAVHKKLHLKGQSRGTTISSRVQKQWVQKQRLRDKEYYYAKPVCCQGNSNWK